MAILRNLSGQNKFTIIPNEILTSRNISNKALGLYCRLCSLPDEWNFTEAGLAAICKDNRDAVRTQLKELEDLNILFRFRVRDSEGKLGESIYCISNHSMSDDEKNEIVGRYQPEDILIISPVLEKSTLVSRHNKILNNKILNNIYIDEKNVENPPEEGFDDREDILIHDFEIIYAEYPRKEGKNNAFKAYKAWKAGKKILGKTVRLTNEEMYNAVLRYKEDCMQSNREKKYIKQADTFFRNINEYVEGCE